MTWSNECQILCNIHSERVYTLILSTEICFELPLWLMLLFNVDVTEHKSETKAKKKKKNRNNSDLKKNGPQVAKTFHTRTAWKQFFTEFQQFFSLR